MPTISPARTLKESSRRSVSPPLLRAEHDPQLVARGDEIDHRARKLERLSHAQRPHVRGVVHDPRTRHATDARCRDDDPDVVAA